MVTVMGIDIETQQIWRSDRGENMVGIGIGMGGNGMEMGIESV